jgi:hypothetical protein
VADLIDYAEGRAGADDRRRIELHLQTTSCMHCRGWIARASASPPSAVPSLPDNPDHAWLVASNPKWLPQALADLEQRLQELDD